MTSNDKAQRLCDSLKAAGLEANAGLIRVYNLSENDRGPTDHEAVAMIKPTGTAEVQVASCALIQRVDQRLCSSSDAV